MKRMISIDLDSLKVLIEAGNDVLTNLVFLLEQHPDRFTQDEADRLKSALAKAKESID